MNWGGEAQGVWGEASTGQQRSQLRVGPQGVGVTRECEAGTVRGAPKATVAVALGRLQALGTARLLTPTTA